MNKFKNILTWTITIAAVLMPLYGAYGKLFSEGMKNYMASAGLQEWTLIIGLGELIAVILFLVPKTYKVGLLLMSSLMGGAITLHMSRGESFTMQVVILILVWISGYLRYQSESTK